MDRAYCVFQAIFKRFLIHPLDKFEILRSILIARSMNFPFSFIPLFRYFDYHSGGVEMATASNQIRAGQSVKRFTVTRRV